MQDAVCLGLPMDEGAKREVPVDLAKAIVGLRPSFSAHVRFGERGPPVRFPPAFW
jgi:hypothetical protein